MSSQAIGIQDLPEIVKNKFHLHFFFLTSNLENKGLLITYATLR